MTRSASRSGMASSANTAAVGWLIQFAKARCRRMKSPIWNAVGTIALGTAIVFVGGCRRDSGPTGAAQPKTLPPPVATLSKEAKQEPVAAETGTQLFARHCASCHGERGDGKGIAAAFLFPRPRDFRTGRFRLVSASNNVPTRDDIQAVLLRGMPGSAMPPWAHLSQSDRDALVDEVLRLRSEGVREAYIKQLKDDEGLSDEQIAAPEVEKSIQDYVNNLTVPGEVRPVPTIGPPTDEAIVRGKENYAKFVCISCHGETGRGDGVQAMNDDDGTPTRPRDFTLGIFKGNPDAASLYRRIAFGMPGTPMPASSSMTPEQMVDLVHFIRSLSTEDQREAAGLKREKVVVAKVDNLPGSNQDSAWAHAKEAHLRLAPLWWRNDADPQFSVKALHDSKTIAIRVSWKDETNDLHALRSESFEDAVAAEFYRGPKEPFLGMGDKSSPVDVWFWDADRQSDVADVEKSYPNAVADVYPFSETKVSSAELNRPGARMADQPDISLPARASGNQIVPPGNNNGGSSLQVGGPKTVTFRMPKNQLVQAVGSWSDGRWTVVMTRSLSAASLDEGVSLEPGARASVAFAVWNGSRHDRNGQKSITIWQDLEIEP